MTDEELQTIYSFFTTSSTNNSKTTKVMTMTMRGKKVI